MTNNTDIIIDIIKKQSKLGGITEELLVASSDLQSFKVRNILAMLVEEGTVESHLSPNGQMDIYTMTGKRKGEPDYQTVDRMAAEQLKEMKREKDLPKDVKPAAESKKYYAIVQRHPCKWNCGEQSVNGQHEVHCKNNPNAPRPGKKKEPILIPELPLPIDVPDDVPVHEIYAAPLGFISEVMISQEVEVPQILSKDDTDPFPIYSDLFTYLTAELQTIRKVALAQGYQISRHLSDDMTSSEESITVTLHARKKVSQ